MVYSFLGDKRTPYGIRKNVPVFRGIEKEYAGLGNQYGVSEWTIGLGDEPKKHALDWVKNHQYNPNDPDTEHLKDAPEYVAIKSTLGELDRAGKAEVTDYNSFGIERKKVVVTHRDPETVVKYEVIKSNKDK